MKKEVLNRCIKHEDFINLELQAPEDQAEWLRISMEEYAQDGDFIEFFRSLEQVIKARGSVRQFAESLKIDRSNLINMLHGKTAPRVDMLQKILNGLGYTLTINKKETA